MALGGKADAWEMKWAAPRTIPVPCSHQDPLANVETLLWKHEVLERGLEARAGRIGALEAAAHGLHRGGHPAAQRALGRCQAILLRYPWLRG